MAERPSRTPKGASTIAGAAITGTRGAPPEDHVAVGTGQLDWPGLLRAAKAAGVKYYFIEDETVAPLQNIPVSVRYLKSLKF